MQELANTLFSNFTLKNNEWILNNVKLPICSISCGLDVIPSIDNLEDFLSREYGFRVGAIIYESPIRKYTPIKIRLEYYGIHEDITIVVEHLLKTAPTPEEMIEVYKLAHVN